MDGWVGGRAGGWMDGWNADWLVYWMICLKSFPNRRIFQKPPLLLSPLVQNGARVGCGTCGESLQKDWGELDENILAGRGLCTHTHSR